MPTMFQKWMVERDALSEAKGLAKGRAEGRAQGRTEGRVDLLLRKLRLRFGALPADTEARIRSSSTDELEVWSDAIFDARSLEDLFGKPPLN